MFAKHYKTYTDGRGIEGIAFFINFLLNISKKKKEIPQRESKIRDRLESGCITAFGTILYFSYAASSCLQITDEFRN
jgi:hypothetical protein